MIKITNVEVYNLVRAIYSARNPLNSWGKSDSDIEKGVLGENDLKLAVKLCSNSADHRKFMRQIFVTMDITAPLYWWKEFDQYRINVTSNSCSTMHKIHTKEFTVEDFSHDHMTQRALESLERTVCDLEDIRLKYLESKDKAYWYDMIQLLPSSYNQLRTCTMNYENLHSIYHARKNHKLEEWHTFCGEIEKLPYTKELIIEPKK